MTGTPILSSRGGDLNRFRLAPKSAAVGTTPAIERSNRATSQSNPREAIIAFSLAYVEARLNKAGRSEYQVGETLSDRPLRSPGEGEGSSVEYVSRGTKSCVTMFHLESRPPRKSHDKKVGFPTKLSPDISDQSQSSSGRIKLLRQLLQSAGAPNEQLSDGCLENLTRLIPLSKQRCTRYSGETDD